MTFPPAFIPAPLLPSVLNAIPLSIPPVCQAHATAAPRRTRRVALRLLSFSLAAAVLPRAVNAARSEVSHPDSNAAPTYERVPCPGSKPRCEAVEICDFRLGTGRAATVGTKLTVRWTGRLADRYGWPIQREDAGEEVVELGKGRLIEGFELGVVGMREGGKRRLVIPAEFGYVDEVKGPLPKDFGDRRRLFATVLNARRFKKGGALVIDVELKRVRGAGVNGGDVP